MALHPLRGLHTLAPRVSHPKTQEHSQENLTEKYLIIHCLLIHWVEPLYIGFYKVNFSDITDVLLKER